MSRTPSRRRISHAITIAIAALGLGLIAPTGVAVSTSSAAALCEDAPSHARVKAGAHGVDPNSVSAKQVRAMNRQLRAQTKKLAARGLVTKRGIARKHGHKNKVVRVKTIVHVITADDGTGGVTRQQVRDQMKVMNDGFRGVTSPDAAPTHFRFVLKRVHYVANDKWFNWESERGRHRDRGRDRGQDRAAPGRLADSQLLHRQPGQRAARLRLVPAGRRPPDRRSGRAEREPARRLRGAVQRGRHRHPRGRPLARALPHVRERLCPAGRLRAATRPTSSTVRTSSTARSPTTPARSRGPTRCTTS